MVLRLTVTVTESDHIFRLCFREQDLTWWVEKVRMEGESRKHFQRILLDT